MDKKKGVVLDPYCGSGTTLVGAKLLGHNYIGIEISKEYIKFVEERLKNYKKESKFAKEEINRHVVVKTFEERKEMGEFTGRYTPQNKKKI